MSKVVLFNRPVWIVVKETKEGRDIKEIYGFILQPDVLCDEKGIDDYLDYLCGSSRWSSEGNIVNDDYWSSVLTNEILHIGTPYISQYMKKSRQQMHVTYLVFDTNKILDKDTVGLYDGEFLTSRELYNNIMEYGSIVDVRNTPNQGV